MYKGHFIEKAFPSGYWHTGVGTGQLVADTLEGLKALIREKVARDGFTPANPSLGFCVYVPSFQGYLEVKGRHVWLSYRTAKKHCDIMNALKCRQGLASCFVEEV